RAQLDLVLGLQASPRARVELAALDEDVAVFAAPFSDELDLAAGRQPAALRVVGCGFAPAAAAGAAHADVDADAGVVELAAGGGLARGVDGLLELQPRGGHA